MNESPSPKGSPGLFGEDASGGYVVLARKYRPRTFADLIGQEAMVRTIANSFALGRVPHATMLTGVRGVGKTTTARLLARALNYRRGDINAPQVELDPPGEHCQAIMESRHPDVFEMDAASRTGIGDIREILDSVRYAPAMARYKVYIIDEVHSYRYAEADDAELDALNEKILLRLQESGFAVPSSTILQGRFAIRCAIVNHRSTRADFDALLAEVERLGEELRR